MNASDRPRPLLRGIRDKKTSLLMENCHEHFVTFANLCGSFGLPRRIVNQGMVGKFGFMFESLS